MKGLRSETTEIKSFLKKICPPDSEEDVVRKTTGEVSIATLPTLGRGADCNAFSRNEVATDTVTAGTMGYTETILVGNETQSVHFYIEPNVVVPTAAPLYSTTVRTTKFGLPDHRQGVQLNSSSDQQGVGNMNTSNNHYGINWNHPFMSNHQYNPITRQFLNKEYMPQYSGVQVLSS